MFDTTEELIKQIALGEDSSLELKTMAFRGNKVCEPYPESIADELSAFANSDGGVMVFGVEDKTKDIVGIPKDKLDAAELFVRGICSDKIDPPLEARIRKIAVVDEFGDEKVLLRVDVNKSLFVHKGANGFFTRIGSSKREMKTDLLTRLIQQRSQSRVIYFDEHVVPEAKTEDVDAELWQKFKTPLSPKDDGEFLSKMKILAPDIDGVLRPTVSGILMASKSPEKYLPGARIQAVCYRGLTPDAAQQLDARDIFGPLDVQIADAFAFVNKNMKVAAVKEPARVDKPQYDPRAVFEAIVNAVAHRDYTISQACIRIRMFADRLEIISPGAIPNTMTIDSIALRQFSRNELLSSLLARCPLTVDIGQSDREHIMDRRGEGVPIIVERTMALTGQKPRFEMIDKTEVVVTIPGVNL